MEIHIANKQEQQAAYALRFEVFVDEQQVPPEIEIDAEDDIAIHVVAVEDGMVVGCARLLLEEDGSAHIGRLAVKKSYRGQGIGAAICRYLINGCRQKGYTYFWLNAQLRAAAFYKKVGFRPKGETFDEAGIDHIKMVIEE